MGSINVKYLLSIVIGLIAGLFVMQEVITARTGIGQLYLYAAIGALFVGLLSPKKAMYLMGFCTVYIDFFKRLMVIGGTPSLLEVAYVLAIPPLLVAGSLISIFLSLIFSQQKIPRDLFIAFVVASIVAVGSMIGSLAGGEAGGLGAVGQMVNQGFYAYIVFIIPVVFPSHEERRKYLQYYFILLLPSILYMYWQEYHGYAQFEYDYLMSGLSIEAKNLSESGFGELRKFGTFNGAGTASTIYSIFLVMCFVSFRPDNTLDAPFKRWMKLLLAPCFMLAAYFTIVRTGWFCGLATLGAYFMLGSRFRAILGVTVAVCGFATVVALAPIAVKQNWLGRWETDLKYLVGQFSDDPALQRAVILGTAGDRLKGWANLTTEPRLWTPFGFAVAGIDPLQSTNKDFSWGHDALIDTLIKFGYVPLFFGLNLAAYMVYRLFLYMYSLPKKSIPFKITRLCLALNAGLLLGGMGNGAQFRNFPQNFYFTLFIAIPFATYQQAMRERKEAKLRAMLEVPQVPRYADLLADPQKT